MAQDLSKQFQVPLVAWGAVAVDVTPASAPSATAGGASDPAAGSALGRAFCFLPLPATTGLPVHVNGFFELSSNRRVVLAHACRHLKRTRARAVGAAGHARSLCARS
jgi:sacsin